MRLSLLLYYEMDTKLTSSGCWEVVHRTSGSVLILIIVVDVVSAAGQANLLLFDEREADALSLRQGNDGVLSDTHAENVAKTGGESVATGVLNMGDLVGTGMLLDVLEDTDATNVITTGTEDRGTVFELQDGIDSVGLKVELHRIVDLDVGVGETNGPAIVGNDVGDLVLSNALLSDLAELEGSLLVVDAVGLETALGVVEDTIVFAGLPDGDDIHEAEGVSVISSFFVVNFDVGALVLHDLDALLVGESQLQTILQQNRHGNALTKLVGASGRACCVHTAELV